jgi:hypothetical protein
MQTSGSRMERRLYSKLYKITEVLYYRYSGGKNFISLLNRDIMLKVKVDYSNNYYLNIGFRSDSKFGPEFD